MAPAPDTFMSKTALSVPRPKPKLVSSTSRALRGQQLVAVKASKAAAKPVHVTYIRPGAHSKFSRNHPEFSSTFRFVKLVKSVSKPTVPKEFTLNKRAKVLRGEDGVTSCLESDTKPDGSNLKTIDQVGPTDVTSPFISTDNTVPPLDTHRVDHTLYLVTANNAITPGNIADTPDLIKVQPSSLVGKANCHNTAPASVVVDDVKPNLDLPSTPKAFVSQFPPPIQPKSQSQYDTTTGLASPTAFVKSIAIVPGVKPEVDLSLAIRGDSDEGHATEDKHAESPSKSIVDDAPIHQKFRVYVDTPNRRVGGDQVKVSHIEQGIGSTTPFTTPKSLAPFCHSTPIHSRPPPQTPIGNHFDPFQISYETGLESQTASMDTGEWSSQNEASLVQSMEALVFTSMDESDNQSTPDAVASPGATSNHSASVPNPVGQLNNNNSKVGVRFLDSLVYI